MAQSGQTGATPLSLRPGVGTDDNNEDIILQQSRLAKDWQECFSVGSVACQPGADALEEAKMVHSHEHLPRRVRSRERRGLTLASDKDGGKGVGPLLQQAQQIQSMTMQQAT